MRTSLATAALCLILPAMCAACGRARLAGRAVLPAATFSQGPTCGTLIDLGKPL